MTWREEYNRKLVTADEAVRAVRSGDWVDYGLLCAQVVDLDKALARRRHELEDVKIWSELTLRPPEIMQVDPRGETFVWNSWHFSGVDRSLAKVGTPIYYAPMRYSELPRYIRENVEPIHVAMRQVAPIDKHGYFNFGPQNSHSQAICERADIVIVEVNENQPRCLGGFQEAVHISQVYYIVEGTNPPLPQLIAPPPGDIDKMVAELIVKELEDGACIQLGIGAMVNAVGTLIAASDLKDLGCHTEMLGDAYLEMLAAGKLTGLCKRTDPGKLAYSFALGSQKLYDFLDDNPQCASFPVDYTNHVSVAAANDKLVAINNALEVDLYGQICSESFGTRHISGTGGQLDFVLAAYESRGGKSFICLPSTRTEKDGSLRSRIVPILTPGAIVTAPRTTAHFIVTEYGLINLKGKTVWQRAEGLINLAHPDYRDDLIKAAQAQGIWRHSNRRT